MKRQKVGCSGDFLWRKAMVTEASDKDLHGRHFEGGAGDRCGMLVLFGKPGMSNFFFTL